MEYKNIGEKIGKELNEPFNIFGEYNANEII